MPFPAAHTLIRAHGAFASSTTPIDGWSVGFRFGSASPTGYSEAALQTFVNSAATAFATFHNLSGTLAGTSTYLLDVTGARIGTDGHYDPPTQQTLHASPAPLMGGQGTPVQPWSAALVCSLRTGRPRGYASNGRAYWPAVGATCQGNTGRILQTQVTTLLTGWKTLINALNTAANICEAGSQLRVFSQVGAGLSAPVTGLRADGRIDSIERRENALPAIYSTVTIP